VWSVPELQSRWGIRFLTRVCHVSDIPVSTESRYCLQKILGCLKAALFDLLVQGLEHWEMEVVEAGR
jgi:hypothetical protein